MVDCECVFFSFYFIIVIVSFVLFVFYSLFWSWAARVVYSNLNSNNNNEKKTTTNIASSLTRHLSECVNVYMCVYNSHRSCTLTLRDRCTWNRVNEPLKSFFSLPPSSSSSSSTLFGDLCVFVPRSLLCAAFHHSKWLIMRAWCSTTLRFREIRSANVVPRQSPAVAGGSSRIAVVVVSVSWAVACAAISLRNKQHSIVWPVL